jgi:hypothetical protein
MLGYLSRKGKEEGIFSRRVSERGRKREYSRREREREKAGSGSHNGLSEQAVWPRNRSFGIPGHMFCSPSGWLLHSIPFPRGLTMFSDERPLLA